jgi:hypothetical protein
LAIVGIVFWSVDLSILHGKEIFAIQSHNPYFVLLISGSVVLVSYSLILANGSLVSTLILYINIIIQM